jgi:hypothetical protein
MGRGRSGSAQETVRIMPAVAGMMLWGSPRMRPAFFVLLVVWLLTGGGAILAGLRDRSG